MGRVRVDLAEVGERHVAFALSGDQSLRPGFVPASGQLTATAGAVEPLAREAPCVPGVVAGGEPVLVEAGRPGQPVVVVAGCDPALGLLAGPLAELSPPRRLAWWPCNSATALALAAAGLVHAAGVHLPEDGPGIGAIAGAELRRAGAEVIGFGAWEEGLALRVEVADGGTDLAGLAERACGSSTGRSAPRPASSSTPSSPGPGSLGTTSPATPARSGRISSSPPPSRQASARPA